ncbi:YciI family protein [Nocardioides endophyticus]|uniref:YciI family protein n=1 Tax=Nocardioides endophyticus TaxID=1353775 RepID=A0ABP8Z7H4_9ACTN
MSQYLLAVNGSAADVEAQAQMTMEEIQPIFEAVNVFNEKLKAEGAWVFAGGLQPIESTTTVDNTGAETVITDGPFVESKEWIGGFWVIEAPDLDAALKWAAEGSKACAGRVEVRPFQDEPEA